MQRPTAKIPELTVSYTDDPQVVKDAATEDYSSHAVPRTWRSSSGSLAMAYWGLMSAMFYLILSATTALAFGSVNTIIGLILSVFVTGTIAGVVSRYATDSGLSITQFSRSMFGKLGASIAMFVFAATCVYYAVFEAAVIAAVFNAYVGLIPIQAWYLVVILTGAPLAIGGVVKWLDKANGVLFPIYVAGMLAAIIAALMTYGYSGDWLTFQPKSTADNITPGWIIAFTIYMGNYAPILFAWDFARFGRAKDKNFNSIVVFGPVFFFLTYLVNGLVGIFLIFTIPSEGGISEISGVIGIAALLGWGGVLFVWASQTRINTTNFYLASTNLQNFFASLFNFRLPRLFWLVIVSILAFVLMLTNIFSYIFQALLIQGIFTVSWVAIVLVQIVSLRRRGSIVEFRSSRVPRINVGGVISWFVPSLFGVVLLYGGGALGQTWTLPITFIFSAILYAAMLRFSPRYSIAGSSGQLDPRDEVDDVWEARIECSFCGHRYIAYEMDRDLSSGYQPICVSCSSSIG